jgi:peptidoglycan/LPS O-acetylase OafA/YrhL
MAICQLFSLPFAGPKAVTSYGLLYLNPLGRLFEFICGMAGALFWRRLEGRYRPGMLAATFVEIAAVALVLVCAWWTGPVCTTIGSWFQGAQYVTLWLSCGGWMAIPFTLLIVLFALGRGGVSRMLSRRWMIVLGEASYSIYLLHFPLIAFFYLTIEKGTIHPAIQLALFIATLLAISLFAWRFVETPFRKKILRSYAEKHAS